MAKSPRKKPNAKLAQKNKSNSPNLIAGVLILVGKPFYFVITRSLLGLVFILYVVGHATTVLTVGILKRLFAFKKQKEPQKKLPKVKTIKTGKTLPKIAFPNLTDIFKLWFLRLSLNLLKLGSRIKKLTEKFRWPKINFKLKLLTPIFLILILIIYFYISIIRNLPSPKGLTNRNPEVSTKIYDRNGNLLYKIYKDKNRTIIPLSKIPKNIQLATLAAEDAEFYNPPGFSIKGISRALISNFNKESLQGGSTITQQLVKNSLLTPERTIARKIKEIILAVEIEFTFPKDKILEMYLNEISYRRTAYRI